MGSQQQQVLCELIQALEAEGIIPSSVCKDWMRRLKEDAGMVARGFSMLQEKLDALREDQSVSTRPSRGQVWRDPNGAKHVITSDMAANWGGVQPSGWTFVCARAHGEIDELGNPAPDYSYTCLGNQFCRCLQ